MSKASYGFDAPGIMRGFLLTGGISLGCGILAILYLPQEWQMAPIVIFAMGSIPLLLGLVMFSTESMENSECGIL